MACRFAVFIAVSLDGYIARENGGIDWLDPYHGEEHGYDEFFASVDALVIGSGTYETVLGFPSWPYGNKRVVVCTRQTTTARHGEQIWSGSPRALVELLERDGVAKVYLDGGALIRSFVKEGLVDEMTINVIPLVLGAGRPLFASGLPEVPLRLVQTRGFASGVVQMSYTRATS